MSAPPDVWTFREFKEWMDDPCSGEELHYDSYREKPGDLKHSPGPRRACDACLFDLIHTMQEGEYSSWEMSMGEDL